ncbi:hypothetical protein GGS23DRAFT_436269 [Durotheca rogersii]|uniref:uncharacterized protein n=1 Tax=Durotheca rogersii TaxID=419775 RepID=UPI002220B766|nr:uncharacterized protein GGS23DRAFT_436269 [Durotheca rogersii]KAI5865634.1 hypothetical protein GGS23DRAFT_436269 [Durotheca rogersii]
MEDAVRPSEEAFKAMYERGYRTWAALWEAAAADNHLALDHLTNLGSVFPNHPSFPGSLAVDKSFSNTVTVRGTTIWDTTRGPCDLSPFQEEVVVQVASSCPTTIVFVSDLRPPMMFPSYFGRENNHVPVLVLAWAYILSARWAELIPTAYSPDYSSHQARLSDGRGRKGLEDGCDSIIVDVGDVDEGAARWWTAILAADSGWSASIRSNTGVLLCSPWSIRTQPGPTFVISANIQSRSSVANHHPASLGSALRYLSEYCRLHGIAEQSQAALTAALLIPVAKFDNKRIKLPYPRLPPKASRGQARTQALPSWDGELRQLDRLLTLSCNSRGVKTLLNSIFFEPGVACNICGAWLQGSFAFLDSDKAKDPYTLLRTFIKRDPDLGFLWFGAFITGAEERCLQEARMGWWKVDISAAAWTGTHVSFIQEVILKAPSAHDISRADECRLTYLSHEQDHAVPPLFPFAPFGYTAMEDTDLDVRRHVRCSAAHGLEYSGFTWDCQGGKKVEQGRNGALAIHVRLKVGQPPSWSNSVAVDYDSLDFEDEVSEMVTRNVFTWLRGEDGFPVAERAIRQHEWIDNLESDDDSPIKGDVLSTVGGNLGGWLLGLATRRSNSL